MAEKDKQKEIAQDFVFMASMHKIKLLLHDCFKPVESKEELEKKKKEQEKNKRDYFVNRKKSKE